MNYLKSLGTALLILLCGACIHAQEKIPLNEPDYNKPRLFNNLPSSIIVDTKTLSDLFTEDITVGKEIRIPMSNGFQSLIGKVVSATSKYENSVKSVVIRLTNYNGAAFTLSSSTNPDGTASFVGRIVSFQHGDAFELMKKGDLYVLSKKTINEMILE